MDWSPPEKAAPTEAGPVEDLLPPASAELQELSFSLLPGSSSSGRRLGRKISHKKSASDTFAFAAGQDFLSLLAERPRDEAIAHTRQASTGFELSAGAARAESGKNLGAVGFSQQAFGGSLNSLSEVGQDDSLPAPDVPRSIAAAGASKPAQAADTGPGSTTAPAAAAAEDVPGSTQTRSNALDTNQLDPRKAKRILANRQSAQRSRMKRLQYISELEGRKAQVEAVLKELKGKVDRAQRGQAALAVEVEQKKTEVSTLEQQLLYEQAVQASLSSYVQSLQLQYQQQQQEQQQQQWGYSSEYASYQMQQCATVSYACAQNGAYSYGAAATQYGAEQQQACYGTDIGQAAPAVAHQQQQQQQWPSQPGVHSNHHQQQHQQQSLQSQQQACGYGYAPVSQLQTSAGALQGQQQQQQPTSSLSAPAAGRHSSSTQAAAPGARAINHAVVAQPPHLPAQSGTAAAVGGGGGNHQTSHVYHHQQHQQHQQHAFPQGPSMMHTAGAGGGAAGGSSAAFAAAHTAAQAAAGAGGPDAALQLASAAGATDVPSRPVLSQGSGSVLLHGSLSDADLDSFLGLGTGESAEIQGLLGDGDSDFMLTPDDLLLRDPAA